MTWDHHDRADHSRAARTLPIFLTGPAMDAIGARWVLGFGAVCAVGLAWWGDLKRLDEDDFLPEDDGGEPFRPVNANRLF